MSSPSDDKSKRYFWPVELAANKGQLQHFISNSVSPRKVKVNSEQLLSSVVNWMHQLSVRWFQITLRGIVCALRLVPVKWGQAEEWSWEGSYWWDSRSLGGRVITISPWGSNSHGHSHSSTLCDKKKRPLVTQWHSGVHSTAHSLAHWALTVQTCSCFEIKLALLLD